MMNATDIQATVTKPVHGAPRPRNVPSDMTHSPPVPCSFSVGDSVVYTNDYGVTFAHTIRGFTTPDNYQCAKYGRFVYLDKGAWWYPVQPDSLRHA